MSKRIDMSGQRYGRLEVIKYSHTESKGKAMWECKCDCGNTTYVRGENLRQGVVNSCGCLKREIEKETNTTHGLSKTRLYGIWSDMKRRCYNPKNKEYKNYGGRGIIVCDEWINDFVAFKDWAMEHGYNDILTIDRIEVDESYSPSNCKWATWQEQAKNKRLSSKNTTGIKGVTYKKDRGIYLVRISVDGIRKFVGEYKTIEEAKKAREDAEKQYWG